MHETRGRGGARPTGRVELLAWVNDICGTHYPSVETLRDGLGYLSLVEATIARTEDTTTPDEKNGERLPRRAVMARNIIEKADLDVTERLLPQASSSSSSPAAVDPSQDSIQVRERCERNFHLLQEMLRKCVDREQSVELDVKRLASGKLQEHMRLLQWSVGFVSSRFATAKRKAAAAAASATTPRGGGSGTDRQGRPTKRSSSASASRRVPPTTTPRGGADSSSPQPASSYAASSAVAKRAHSVNSAAAHPHHHHRPTTNDSAHQLPSGGGVPTVAAVASHYDPSKYRHQPPVEGHQEQQWLGVKPVSVDHPELTALAREVAELEAEVWRRGPVAGGADDSGKEHEDRLQSVAHNTNNNNLVVIRDLLRERDVLWQTLVAVEAVVWRDAATSTATNTATAQSQLLRDLCSVFQVAR